MTKVKFFETALVSLKIKGRHYTENKYKGITPAEFLMLQELHGPHSVRFIAVDGKAELRRISHDGKWQHRPLTMRELHEKLVDKYKGLVKKVYPTSNPVLPYTFEDIGVSAEKPGGELAELPTSDENEDLWEPMKVQPVAQETAPAASVDDLVGVTHKDPAQTGKKKAG